MAKIRVGFVSLGCAKNLVDSEVMLGELAGHGFVICERPEDADVVVINTCCFIGDAREESRSTIRQALKLRDKGTIKRVVVAGCMVRKASAQDVPELREADALVGLFDVHRLAEACRAAAKPRSGADPRPDFVSKKPCDWTPDVNRLRLTPRHFAYVRIADGCDNRCTYCIIPDVRGRYRSKPKEMIISEVRELAADGAKEICLIAQDTSFYGCESGGKGGLRALLESVCAVDGVEWVRLLYTHPAHLGDDVLDVMASEKKIVKYVDLPIQHISDPVLKAMGRRAGRRVVEGVIWKIRSRIPGAFIRSTVIVGFPGETEAQFRELLDFLGEARFERLGAFAYSREEGTAAAKMAGQIPEEIKQERFDAVMSRQQEIAFAFNKGLIGKKVECIVDGPDGKARLRRLARTYGDAPEVDGMLKLRGSDAAPGSILTVTVTGVSGYDLVGRPAQ
jgi:ribosomal protein S12 methylthiotransferase